MTSQAFYQLLLRHFPFNPTVKQDLFFQMIADFATADREEIFVLKGYAGTGKTTLVSALVEALPSIRGRFVLLAPTGRAAKVMAQYSGQPAHTIHRKIYYPKKQAGGGVGFTLMPNKHKNTLFFVDEASMIADTGNDYGGYTNNSLLDDLVEYVYTGDNCKLLLLGDTAQLPPVGMEESPALDMRSLLTRYGMNVRHIELDEVMRQAQDSGILYNATAFREQLQEQFYEALEFQLRGFKDVVRLTDGYDIQDAINNAYSQYSVEDTAFVVRSNKRANQYNHQIRARILDKESELSAGDYMMVVKNNYFWLRDGGQAGFIANGDIIEVLEIYKIQELYGFKFARVKVRMIDYPEQLPFETVLLLDTTQSESPALTYEQSNRLYQEVMADYAEEPAQYKRMARLRENPYFNALQVKFSYAITCHKAQGGQWDTVFIEHPYLPDGIDAAYLRWLYTAVTRAQRRLYLIGFPDEFFND